MEKTEDGSVIFRSAAIGGRGVVPALKRLSKPGEWVNTVPGAAQTALAKLGDKDSLNQIEQELNHGPRGYAVHKLLRLGDDKAIFTLMSLLVSHIDDHSLYVELGDSAQDLRLDIVRGLANILPNPPGNPGLAAGDPYRWIPWWEENKTKQVALVIHSDFHDRHLQCLVRKVEWGFPDAILDLATSGGKQVVPLLRILTQIEGKRRNARIALAKLGDEEAFDATVHDLDSISYQEAIESLQFIGGKNAVQALITGFDSSTFLSNTIAPVEENTRERDSLIMRALPKMVSAPPELSGPTATPQKWKDWWAKNKSTARFLPTTTYE